MNQNKANFRWVRTLALGLLCLLGWGQSTRAQVHVYADSVVGASGSQVVVAVSANDFTNLIGAQGSLGWDTSVAVLDTVFQFGLPNLGPANFGLAQAPAGRLSFSWDDPNFLGVSVPDSTTLFALRFDVVGTPGDRTPVAFQNVPTPIEFTDNNFSVISFSSTSGEVEVGLAGNCGILSITAGSQTACDPATNRYAQSLVLTYGNDPGAGSLIVNGQTFPIAGSPQTVTLTNLVSDGLPVDVTAFFDADTACARLETNSFTSPATCGTLLVFADSVIGTTGGTVSVPVRVRNFVNLIGAQGTVEWNTSVVTFDTVSNFGLPGMTVSNFGLTQTGTGRLPFSWDDPTFSGVSVADSTVIFVVEFNVVGNPGTNSPVSFINSPTNLEFIDPTFSSVAFATQGGEVDVPLGANCAVQGLSAGPQTACDPQTNAYTQAVTVTYANAPATGTLVVNGQSFPIGTSPQTVVLTNLPSNGAPVDVSAFFSGDSSCARLETNLFTAPAFCGNFLLFADSVTGTTGGTVSVPVRVRNFVNLIGAQGTVGWDTAVVTYSGVSNFGLPGMNVSNFGLTQTAGGRLPFSWDDPTFSGVSVPDSTVIFEIEFNVVGGPGTQTPVSFLSAPTNLEFIDNSFAAIPFFTQFGEVDVPLGSNCAVQGLAAGTTSACDPLTNTYDQTLTVTYANAPATGSLVVNGENFPITTSPQTVVLTGLLADAQPVDVSAFFSDDSTCARLETALFTAPASCGVFQIFADSVTGTMGGTVSVPVRVRNFVNLIGMQGSMSWSTSVVTFSQVSNFGLPNFNVGNLGLSQTASGVLTFSWDDPLFAGVTVPDSSVIFEIEFNVVGTPGTQTPVAFQNTPTNFEFTDNTFQTIPFITTNGEVDVPLGSSCAVLGLAAGAQGACDSLTNRYSQAVTVTYANPPGSGFLVVQGQSFPVTGSPQTVNLTGLYSDGQSVDVTAFFSADSACAFLEPNLFTAPTACGKFRLIADSLQGNTGSQVIVPVRVRNFIDLIGLQGSIEWDISVADFDAVLQFGLPNLAVSNFGTGQTANGKLTFSWDDPTFNGVNVADSTVIFALQFTVVGGPGSATPVAFDSSPTLLEVTNNSFQTIGFDTIPGHIEVPIVGCAITDLAPGAQSACNQVNNTYAQDIEVTYTTAPSSGLLLVNGQPFAIGTSPQTVTVTGLPSNGLPVNVTASFSDDTTCFRTENALFQAPFSCISANPTLFADSIDAIAGTQVIVPVRVRNFADLIGMQGTIEWNTSIATYDTVFQFGLPNLGLSNFGTPLAATGRLPFSWDDPTLVGVSVPDSAVVFAIRFDVIGSPGTQTPIQFVDNPTVLEFTSNTFQSLPYDTIPGEIEVLVTSIATDTFGGTFCIGDTVTVPFTTSGIFQSGNVFTAELSDANGSFAVPTVIGSVAGTNSSSVTVVIPSVPGGSGYRIRVRSSNPPTIGGDNGLDLVIPNIQVNASAAICDGDSILLGGAFQTAPGTFVDTLTAVNGCDSVVTTTLIVNPVFATADTQQICQGDSFLLGGAFQTTSGSYVDTLASVEGCDSVVTTFLDVTPSVFTFDTLSICADDSAFLAGAFQTIPGNYVDTLVAAGGCDSILTTALVVRPLAFDTVQVAICDGDSILIGGTFQSAAGSYAETLTAANGCDSVVTTVVTVLPVFATVDTAEICEGDNIVLGGAFQTQAGNYIDILATVDGCDSVVTTTLNVIPTLFASETVRICAGDSIFLQNAFQTTPGNYLDTLLSSLGCDSVLTTMLLVDPVYAVNDTVQICQGDSAFLQGAFQTTAGTYIDTLLTNQGCDSVVTTDLQVVPTLTGTATVEICGGDSVFLGGAFQTVSGSYNDTLVSSAGCDSVLTTTLAVLPNAAVTIQAAICAGDSVFAGGAFQTAAGTYVDTLVANNGCDSVRTTVATVLPVFAVLDTANICDGDSIVLGGAFQTQAGNYVDTLTTLDGCDSVVTTTLNVVPTVFGSVTARICAGDSIFLENAFQTTPGNYTDTLLSSLGCDSVLTTSLIVDPVYAVNDTLQICDGDSAFLGGAFQTVAGSYIDTLLTNQGCDSVVTTALLVAPTFLLTQSDTICQGDFLVLPGGDTATVAGTYTDSLATLAGCDSVWITQLTVNPTFALAVNADICQGDSFLLPGGTLVSVSGSYVDTLLTQAGCDSIITTDLVVNPTYTLGQTVTLCDGDSVVLPGGSVADTAGIYVDSLTTGVGCDSVWTTTVIVLPTYDQNQTAAICAGDTFFLPGGDTVFTAGNYLDTLSTTAGCDSIIRTDLTVNPTFTVTVTDSICGGDSYLLPGGTVVTVGGLYADTFATQFGCDSIIITDLLVNPVFNQIVTVQICQGDSVQLPGGGFADTAGVYTDSLLTGAGCDSVIVTTLVVDSVYLENVSAAICDGDSFLLPGGTFVGIAGTYTDTLSSLAGCDSIVVTALTVNPTFFANQTAAICAGDTFFLPSGAPATTSGTFLDTLTTQAGCDSIFSVDLTVNPSFNQSQSVDICQGDSVALPGGQIVGAAGLYADTLLTNLGCDSIIQTTVTVLPVYNQSVSTSICAGDSFVRPGGQAVSVAGVYTDSLLTGAGCDSVIVTTLTVNPTYANSLFDTICQGDSYLLPGGASVTATGVYNDTLTTVNGCDSVFTVNLTVNPTFNTPVSAAICDGDTYTLPGGATVTTAGVYPDTFQTQGGCDSIIVTTLTVNPSFTQSLGASICSGDSYTLPSGTVVNTAGTYTDTLPTNAGCDSIIVTMLTVNQSYFSSQSAAICSNESFTLPGGAVVTTAGFYTDTLLTVVGCDSIIETALTVDSAYAETVLDSICDGDSYVLPGGTVVNTSGFYVDSLTTFQGCDSIIETDLTVISIDTGVTLTVNTLTSEQNNATYQWLDCSIGIVPIGGETNQTFTPAVDGLYAVIATVGDCFDTSACTQVVLISVEPGDLSSQLEVYPNPGAGNFYLDLGETMLEAEVEVFDARGKLVWRKAGDGVREMGLDLEAVSDGLYFVRVQADDRNGTVKLLIRR